MPSELKLLIIDEDPDRRVNTRRSVQQTHLAEVYEMGYGTRAVSLALDTHPDIILVTVEEPVGRALETVEALANVLPSTPAIICSSIDDPEAIRRAMRMGARDYIALPVHPHQLEEAVNTVLLQEERRQMCLTGQLNHQLGRGTVITVTGGKGGIGKSVISVNLALGLGRHTGMSVAILDADTEFGDVATMLDISPSYSVKDLISQLAQVDRHNISDFQTEYGDSVRVLAASNDEEVWTNCSSDDLKNIIDLLAQTHDFVVVDTAGSFDRLVRACVESSTLTLVVTSGEICSILNTTIGLGRMESWGIPQDNYKVVLNRGAMARGINLGDLAEAIGRQIFWDVPYDRRIPASVQLGQPAVLFNDSSPAARNLMSLSRMIAGTRKPLVQQPKQSLFKRLLGRRLINS
ncbi:MAG TPA: P-loop NTPase [Dehalococcoidia bacterium]|nr:P-loop NTPase [Dehalococcoidia bacterium]